MRFYKEMPELFKDILGFCGVCVNEDNLGGKYGRIQEGHNQLNAGSVG